MIIFQVILSKSRMAQDYTGPLLQDVLIIVSMEE